MLAHLNAREEALLKEILEHRNSNGCCDYSYWEHRFEDPDLTHDEENLLRGTFGKLKQKGMINTLWASNVPYEIDVLSDGLTYFEDKGTILDTTEKPSVFVSYQQASGKEFVDDLEEALAGRAYVLRDKNLEAWGDLPMFMESIREQNFAVMVITDGYLKSSACMVEVTHFMRERNWSERVMFAVLDDSIYGNTIEYCRYWEDRKKVLSERRKSDNIGDAELQNVVNEIAQISKFSAELNDFFEVLCAKKNPKVWCIIPDILRRIEDSKPFDLLSELPPNIHQIAKLENTKQKMGQTARTLLLDAVKKRQQIVCLQDLGGWTIGVNDSNDSRLTDEIHIAELREAIEQLETLSLIRAEGHKRQVFSITAEGYRVANQLEVDKMLE